MPGAARGPSGKNPLLAVWFLAGPVSGILLVEPLNRITLSGLPVGFWMSKQGSIYVFVVLIFIYAWLSDRADRAERAARDAEQLNGVRPGDVHQDVRFARASKPLPRRSGMRMALW